MPRLAIDVVIHESDAFPRERPHLVWQLATAWRRQGYDVNIVRFPERPRPHSIVLPHFDLTRWPDAYRRYIAVLRQPVINAKVSDQSKRSLSRHLVDDRNDPGPVIVKANANAGGCPERKLTGHESIVPAPLRSWYRFADRKLNHLRPWRRRTYLPASQYRVYPSAAHVPAGVFDNPHLVVERFMPERVGEDYALRIYRFLGDRCASFRLIGRAPVIKAGAYQRMEACDVHPDIVARRQALGFDYGKFDYVIHDGRAVLLDANPTPGSPGRVLETQGADILDDFCRGIEACVPEHRPHVSPA